MLLLSVRHSGTHFMMRCLGGEFHWLHFGGEHEQYRCHGYSRDEGFIRAYDGKIVIPVRDKELVRESHLNRGYDLEAADFDGVWDRVMSVDGFHFDMEIKPFDELEAYLGRPVSRDTSIIRKEL